MSGQKAEELFYKAFMRSGKVGYYMLSRAVLNAPEDDDEDTESDLPE